MTAVERPRLIDQVLISLLRQIQSTGLGPGDVMPRERELGIELGVSRSMIRQAFRVLDDRGIVASRQGSGRYLRAAAGDDPDVPHALETASIVDILETRAILERNGVALACERRTSAEAGLIAERARSLTSWQDNMAFHLAIASATHNFMLERLVREQIDLADQLHQRGRYADPNALENMKNEHTAIAEAIMNRDAESASALMVFHLHRTSKAALAFHRRNEDPS